LTDGGWLRGSGDDGRAPRGTPVRAAIAALPTRILSVDRKDHMADPDRISKLRHDLSNPLSALLAETQLLLLNEAQIDPATVVGLKEIEALAIRMRTMLREI
jgi:hypothetical protein